MSEFLFTVFGIFLGAYGSHLLSRDSARTDRIRSARAKVRGWIDEIDAYPGYLTETHEQISIHVAELKNTIIDDIRFWRKSGFLRACSDFINSTEDDCRATQRPFRETLPPEEQEKERQEWLRPGRVLTSRLEAILKRI